MKKIFILPALLILSQLLLCSCASQKDMVHINRQMSALFRQTKEDRQRFEKAIKELEQALEAKEVELKGFLGEVIREHEIELKEQKQQKGLREAIRAQESKLSELFEIIRAHESKISEIEQALKK